MEKTSFCQKLHHKVPAFALDMVSGIYGMQTNDLDSAQRISVDRKAAEVRVQILQ